MTKRWTASGSELDSVQTREVARLLHDGGVAILPTDTIYGFHAVAFNASAIARIFHIKERGGAKPLAVIAADMQQVEQLGAILRQDVRKTLQSIWPAPLTAIVPIAAPVAASAGALSLAIRIPAAPWLRRLLSLTGPLASTSANKSGESPLISVAKLPSEFEREVDGIVDGGVLAGVSSTIVDFTESPPAVTREGAFRFTQNLWKTSRKSL